MSKNADSSQAKLAKLAAGGIPVTRKSTSTIAGKKVLKNNEELLGQINRQVSPSPINGYASLVNYSPTAGQPIHRWFRYREGYSIELVKELIKGLPKGSIILDPFCGAGTSLLAAREVGLPSIGIDVNPISTLVSKVKTTVLTSAEVQDLYGFIKGLSLLSAKSLADDKPSFKIIDKVFEKNILHALLVFRHAIKQIESTRVRDFIFVAWLSMLENVSNVYKEGNGLKYKNRKRTDQGYIHLPMEAWQRAVFPNDKFTFVRDRLIQQLNQMIDDLAVMPKKENDVKIIEGSAEDLNLHVQSNSIAMAVFSPPYCNCFNYFKMYKVELWMGEFVNSYEEMQALSRRGLRSHVETKLNRQDDVQEPISESFASLLDGVPLWDKRIPMAVRGYFIDMRQVLKNIYDALRSGGKAVIIVGNSSYGGVIIPTDAILAEIGASLGFTLEKLAVARHLTTSSQQRAALTGDRKDYLRESLVILTKQDPRLTEYPLISVDELPNKREEVENKVFAIKNTGLTAFTHKFHRYPGKFIPHIPRWALRTYLNSTPAVVLDPFCGSGTSLVEAVLSGHYALGVDIDPIAKLVSRVKTTKIDTTLLGSVISEVEKKVLRRTVSRFRPQISTLSHWFSEDAIVDLGVIRDVIEEYRDYTAIYEFLLVCFAAIIRRTSNADNETQKTYVSHTKPKVPEAAKPLFISIVKDYTTRLSDLSHAVQHCSSTILEGVDAKTFHDYWNKSNSKKVDLIITSPPYLNSVDYVYNQMAEYFWIGDLFSLENQTLQNEHKAKYIGTEKVKAELYNSVLTVGIEDIDSIVHKIYQKDKKNAFVVAKYFADMCEHFISAKKVLKSKANYVCVIGDSVVSGESIPVHELIVKCAERAGLTFKFKFGYEIRNRHMRFPRMGRGGIVKYDWVLNFSNSSK